MGSLRSRTNIHPTAIVHPEAQLAEDVEIGPWCTVGPKVILGRGTRLVSHVVIEGNTSMGERNVVFPFSVLGAVPQDLKYRGEDTRLVIGDENTIRESVTLNLGTVQGGGETRVGNRNLIMAYSHLGHDAYVQDHCILANGSTLAGHVVLGNYVTLGGLTAVSQFARVGDHAYIGGQSGVEKDIPPFTIAVGQRPCQLKGANIVGLRRRGFAADTISKLNEAIKLWIRPDVEKERCLLEIESQYGEYPDIQRFVGFIRESEKGTTR